MTIAVDLGRKATKQPNDGEGFHLLPVFCSTNSLYIPRGAQGRIISEPRHGKSFTFYTDKLVEETRCPNI